MKALILPIALLFTVLWSCKKEKNEPEQNNNNPGLAYTLPSTVGSYWVYQQRTVDSLGNVTALGLDSLFILGDSVINGNTYVMFGNTQGSFPSLSFERDSSGYIVNQNGYVLYSYVNLGDTLQTYLSPGFPGPNGPFTLKRDVYMFSNKVILTTPTGVFSSYKRRVTYIDSAGGPLNVCEDLQFNSDSYYASGIGKIRVEYWYFGSFVQECKWQYYELVDYYVAP